MKGKNILYENDCIQIGCKLTGFYDFYSSKNLLVIKLKKKIQNFNIHYKGTSNL